MPSLPHNDDSYEHLSFRWQQRPLDVRFHFLERVSNQGQSWAIHSNLSTPTTFSHHGGYIPRSAMFSVPIARFSVAQRGHKRRALDLGRNSGTTATDASSGYRRRKISQKRSSQALVYSRKTQPSSTIHSSSWRFKPPVRPPPQLISLQWPHSANKNCKKFTPNLEIITFPYTPRIPIRTPTYFSTSRRNAREMVCQISLTFIWGQACSSSTRRRSFATQSKEVMLTATKESFVQVVARMGASPCP